MRGTNRQKVEVLRWTVVAVAVFLLAGCVGSQVNVKYQLSDQSAAPGQTMRWSFDTDPVGGLPRGGTVFSGTWIVGPEGDAPSLPNVLCQTGTAEFPAQVLGDTVYTDVVLSAHFKPVSGRMDQAAGLIFRVQDKNNYYILRANALEDNVNIYKYAGGQRSSLGEGSAKVASGQWQELRADVVGNRIRGFLNGQLVVEAADDAYNAGKVGLWAKADSITCFDDVAASAQ